MEQNKKQLSKKQKKRILSNSIMVFAICLIAVSGFMLVAQTKGWIPSITGRDDADAYVVEEMIGDVAILRNGVSYSLQEGNVLRKGDRIETGGGTYVRLCSSEQRIDVDEHTVFSVEEDKRLELGTGNLIVQSTKELVVTTEQGEGRIEAGILGVSAPSGSTQFYSFSGGIQVGEQTILEGDCYCLLASGNEQRKLQVEQLSQFYLQRLIELANDYPLWAEESQLHKELERREQETNALLAKKLKASETDYHKATDIEDEEGRSEAMQDSSEETTEAGTQQESGEATTQQDTAEPVTEEATGEVTTEEPKDIPKQLECTITIRCDTILNHMDELAPGKDKFVPANGCILANSTVTFTEGETVFQVLQRVCSQAGIPLEYSWTPMYDSYYIEGINQLYEFDCGEESGWTYKVNGWFPNYGCSAYTLQQGDQIVWCYTCEGLGADVGKGM